MPHLSDDDIIRFHQGTPSVFWTEKHSGSSGIYISRPHLPVTIRTLHVQPLQKQFLNPIASKIQAETDGISPTAY